GLRGAHWMARRGLAAGCRAGRFFVRSGTPRCDHGTTNLDAPGPLMITAAGADARAQFGRPAAAASADEVIDAVQSNEADDDEVDGDNVVQQPRHDQDQNAGDEGDQRRDMGNGDGHEDLLGRVDELQNAVMVPNSSLPGIARRKTRVNALLTRQSILLTRRWMRGSSPRMTQ